MADHTRGRRLARGIALTTAATGLLALTYFGLRKGPGPLAVGGASGASSVPASNEWIAATGKVKRAGPLAAPHVLGPEAAAEVKKCLPTLLAALLVPRPAPTDPVETMEGLLAAVRSSFQAPAELSLVMETFHLTLPGGEQRRLRVSVDESAGPRGRLKLQLHGVDREGLSVSLPVPEGDVIPTPEILDRYLAQGKVTFHQRHSSLRIETGTPVDVFNAELVEENGAIESVQLAAPGGSLGCAYDQRERKTRCRCLPKFSGS